MRKSPKVRQESETHLLHCLESHRSTALTAIAHVQRHTSTKVDVWRLQAYLLSLCEPVWAQWAMVPWCPPSPHAYNLSSPAYTGCTGLWQRTPMETSSVDSFSTQCLAESLHRLPSTAGGSLTKINSMKGFLMTLCYIHLKNNNTGKGRLQLLWGKCWHFCQPFKI